MTNETMPILVISEEERTRLKDRYKNQLLKYYSSAEKLTPEDYNKIRFALEQGDQTALKKLMDKSLFLIIDAVAEIYSKYDIVRYIPIEDGLSISILKFNQRLLEFTDLPVLCSQYKNSVINYYVYFFLLREYNNSIKRNDDVDFLDDIALTEIIDSNFDCVETHKAIVVEDLRKQFEKAVRTLSPADRNIIMLRFGFVTGKTMTCSEMGEYLGMTASGAQQILARALRRLRYPVRSKFYKDFNPLDMEI